MAGGKMFGGARPSKWSVLLIAVTSAAMAFVAVRSIAGSVSPSGCTSIQNEPVRYTIEFGQAIQGIFNNFDGSNGCVSCHTSPDVAPPSGNLDLTPGYSWGHLVNVPSSNDPSIMYVVPNHPEQSLLFQKVNCFNPADGLDRMPLGFQPLDVGEQAAIYDWIAAGAPITTTDVVFRGTFDIRGFDQ